MRRSRVLDVSAGPPDLGSLSQHGRLCRVDLGARLVHLRREDLRIDLRDHLALPDHGIEVGK